MEIDYHQDEVDFWKSKISFDEVEEFCKTHRVEVIVGSDWMYQLYIDKGGSNYAGCDEVALTFIGALFGGIYKFKHKIK